MHAHPATHVSTAKRDADKYVSKNISSEKVVEVEKIVEIAVVPVICQHTDRATVVSKHLIEPTMFRPKWIVVTQMPLAEHSRRVASILKGGAHDEFVGSGNEVRRKYGCERQSGPHNGQLGALRARERNTVTRGSRPAEYFAKPACRCSAF